MPAKLFVIIVTYKGHQWYERCFTSLRNSEYPLQTIVIDNASNDGTVEYIREHFPEIDLIESKENLGFGRANNIGMRYALDHGCDYVFLLNQDAWVEPSTMSELVRIADKYPEYGIISPMHMAKDMIHLNISLDDNNNNYELLSDLYCGIKKEIYPIRYVNAAAWLMSRSTLELIGGFTPLFIHYGEDDDYLNRMNYHHKKIGICPYVHIVHDHTTLCNTFTSKKMRNQQYRLLQYLDINKPENSLKYLLILIKRMVLNLLKGNCEVFKQLLQEYSYLRKHRKHIIDCYNKNKLLQSNWL